MSDNTTLNTMSGGDVVEDIDGANGTGGVKRQVVALGGIGKSGSHTALTAGQATAASSIPVVLASDPDSRPASGTITAQDTGSSAASGQDSISLVTGTASASSTKSFAINGQASARVQITGTWAGTLAFEGSIDGGTTWFAQPMRVSGLVHTRASVTGNGLFEVDVSGLTNLRVRSTAAMTGTATVQATFSALFVNAPPSGLGVIGQRPFPVVKGGLNNTQTSYAANTNWNIGGLVTASPGLPPGTVLSALTARVRILTADVSGAAPTQIGLFFDGNPTGSTIAENTALSIVAADMQKAYQANSAAIGTNAGSVTMYTFASPRLTLDASGNFYFAFCTSGAALTLNGTNKFAYELDGLY